MLLPISRRYGFFSTYKAVLDMRGHDCRRWVLGFVCLNLLPVLHFALLMSYFGSIYVRSDFGYMPLGLLVIGLQSVAVFGYHRVLEDGLGHREYTEQAWKKPIKVR
jgi:hypothetical protein